MAKPFSCIETSGMKSIFYDIQFALSNDKVIVGNRSLLEQQVVIGVNTFSKLHGQFVNSFASHFRYETQMFDAFDDELHVFLT